MPLTAPAPDPNPFRRLLATRHDRTPVGTWVMSASALVAEAVGCAGFDWAVLDMEHSPLDVGDVVRLLQAVSSTPLVPVVRVPWNDAVAIKRVLDAGAQTLMVPFVQDADAARRAVAATRYPPAGVRGMAGMSRASRFGTVADPLVTADAGIAVVLQLETPQALAQLEAIAAVPGVDALFLGPADLSGAMGLPGQLLHPRVLAAMDDACRRARVLGVPVGSVGGTPEDVARYRQGGCDYVAIASDLGLLMRGLQGALAGVRGPVDRPAAP